MTDTSRPTPKLKQRGEISSSILGHRLQAYRAVLSVIEQTEPGSPRRTRAGTGRPARVTETDRLGELRLARVLLTMGTWLSRQVRRGHHRAPLLRRLPEHRHRRVGRRRARARAVRRRVRLRPTALRHRRQPGRLLGDPGQQDRVPALAGCRSEDCQRPDRGAMGDPAAQVRQPASAGHVAGRRRPPHPRLPTQHLRQDVPPALLRHRSRDPAAGLRRRARGGAGVQATDPDRRLLRLPASDQLRHDARDRRRGRARP